MGWDAKKHSKNMWKPGLQGSGEKQPPSRGAQVVLWVICILQCMLGCYKYY